MNGTDLYDYILKLFKVSTVNIQLCASRVQVNLHVLPSHLAHAFLRIFEYLGTS